VAYDFSTVKVMVVDDNAPMLRLTESILSAFGVKEIITATDGHAGFEIFCRENPDLLIADWMMDNVDGITLARRIRNHQKSPNPYVPIILMTGLSQRQRVFQARDAGVTEFLVKPFNARDLYRRIAQIIEKPRQFVRSENFFGPDRRRIASSEYKGPERRKKRGQKEVQTQQRLKKYTDVLRSTGKDDIIVSSSE